VSLSHHLNTVSDLLELIVQPNVVRAIGVDFDPARPRYRPQITCTTAADDAEKLICSISSGCGGRVDEIKGALFAVHRTFEALHGDVTACPGRLVERRSKNR